MDFSIDAAMQTYLDRAEALVPQLAAGYQQREHDRCIPVELRTTMGEAGLIAPEIPTEYGGQGERALTSGMIIERLSRADLNVTYVRVVASLVAHEFQPATPPSELWAALDPEDHLGGRHRRHRTIRTGRRFRCWQPGDDRPIS